MNNEQNKPGISYEVRVTTGRDGNNPDAPDWEVCELEDGVVRNNADVYDNLTLAEATGMAAMWTKKKDEAETQA